MREIKFRGKRVDNGEWVYGFYIQKQNPLKENGKPIVHWIVDVAPFGYKVIEETVGQFTGLYDKKGKEIYEGDIVVGYGTWNLIVSIEKGHTVIKWTDYDLSKQCVYLEREWINGEEAVVIGNIHDNKELL